MRRRYGEWINCHRIQVTAFQRPWVRAIITPAKVQLNQWGKRRFIGMRYYVAVENAGRLPAGNITIYGALFPHITDARESELDGVQSRFCVDAEKASKRDRIAGITIFPNHPDQISNATSTPFEQSYYYLTGCIDYTYGIGRHGKTAFRYILGASKDSQFAPIPFPKTRGTRSHVLEGVVNWDIPLNKITFHRDDVGNYAE